MILYIVRHGIAMERDARGVPAEAERPLTPEGVHKTRAAALGLRALGAKPGAVITSPYVRAAQTAEIFAEALGFSPDKISVSESLKPAENPAAVMRQISRLKTKEVMCCGHAPHVDLLIAHLAGAQVPFTEMKKAGVACLEQAAAHGRWELLWILPPKVLRELADE